MEPAGWARPNERPNGRNVEEVHALPHNRTRAVCPTRREPQHMITRKNPRQGVLHPPTEVNGGIGLTLTGREPSLPEARAPFGLPDSAEQGDASYPSTSLCSVQHVSARHHILTPFISRRSQVMSGLPKSERPR